MKVYWHNGALNLKPESEEDGAITSAILFAHGTPSNFAEGIFKVDSDSIRDGTDQQTIVGINVSLESIVQSVPSDITPHEPLGIENSVSTD